MTGWRACGMLAFHPYRWNQLRVIPLPVQRAQERTFLDIGDRSLFRLHRCRRNVAKTIARWRQRPNVDVALLLTL